MRILIAVPTFENIYPDTYKSIWDMDKDEYDCIFEYVRGYDCATARNKIVRRAIDHGVDYVFMVDNDVVLPEDVLIRMLEDPRDVRLGYYAHRNEDNLYTGRVNVCKKKDQYGKDYFNYPLESEYTAEELKVMYNKGIRKLLIHGGGMGCALIKTDVFHRTKYPWYDWVNYANGKGMLSEDLYFCENCRKNNIPIFTDTAASCGHIMRHVQWPV